MSLFDGHNLSRRKRGKSDIAKRIGGIVRSLIVKVGAEEAVVFREFVVDAGGEKVFVHNLFATENGRTGVGACSALCGQRDGI